MESNQDNSSTSESGAHADSLSQLSDKQQKFVLSYAEHGNGAKAAREAGYAETHARSEAYRLLQNPAIRTAINAFMEQQAVGAGECIGRLSIWARSSLEPFLTETGDIDLQSDEAMANIGQIKRYKRRKTVTTNNEGFTTETTTVEIELHDAKDAVDKLLQVWGRYKQPLDQNQPKGRILIEMGDGVKLSLNG